MSPGTRRRRDRLEASVAAIEAVIAAADGPQGRALVIDRVLEVVVTQIAGDRSVGEDERWSWSVLLDAADEHCQRMGAFAPTSDSRTDTTH